MNILDKAIGFVSPKWAAQRQAWRNAGDLQRQAAYRGAYATRTSTLWGPSESLAGIPHLNLTVNRNLRDRSRSLYDNNNLAKAIVDSSSTSIVGPGFTYHPMTDSDSWNRQAEQVVAEDLEGIDYHGRTWLEHQQRVCHSFLVDGDIGGVLLSRGQVQLIESDYISSPYNKWKAFYHDGIEIDNTDRVKNYWVMNFTDGGKRSWKSVSPNNFLFVANHKRVKEYRGRTAFHASFDLFDQIDGYIDAVIMAQKIAACLALFIKTADPVGSIAGLRTKEAGKGEAGQKEFKLEPGLVQRLAIGEDIAQIVPSQPGHGFDGNLRMLVRLLGLPFGLPLEYVLFDFSTVSGNTAKAMELAAHRTFEAIQRTLIGGWHTRISQWIITRRIRAGGLEDRPDALKGRWRAAPWPFVEPIKEIQAIKLAVDANLTTERREAMIRGLDYDQLIKERATEEAFKQKHLLPQYHSTYVTSFGENAPAVTDKIEDIDEQDGPTPAGTKAPNNAN